MVHGANDSSIFSGGAVTPFPPCGLGLHRLGSFLEECDPMNMKEIMEKVKTDLRGRPDSHFSDVYARLTENKVTSTEVHNAFYELLKRGEVTSTNGKWNSFTDTRKAS
jgi:hypothetical protein